MPRLDDRHNVIAEPFQVKKETQSGMKLDLSMLKAPVSRIDMKCFEIMNVVQSIGFEAKYYIFGVWEFFTNASHCEGNCAY